VKNLKSHDKGRTFEVIEKTLKKLGYIIFSKIIDAKHYVPQHRERIFIVGYNTDCFGENIDFNFPAPPKAKKILVDILEKNPDPKYMLTDHLWEYLQDYAAKHLARGNGFGFGLSDTNGIARTLSARYYKDGSEILILQENMKNPRRLTPEECRRLMGYPDEFLINKIGVSDTQLYRQFGNSVVVPVVRVVAREVIKALNTPDMEKMEKIRKQREKLLSNQISVNKSAAKIPDQFL
jgi:DNA (cytosine-5)-methyltransferase 1